MATLLVTHLIVSGKIVELGWSLKFYSRHFVAYVPST